MADHPESRDNQTLSENSTTVVERLTFSESSPLSTYSNNALYEVIYPISTQVISYWRHAHKQAYVDEPAYFPLRPAGLIAFRSRTESKIGNSEAAYYRAWARFPESPTDSVSFTLEVGDDGSGNPSESIYAAIYASGICFEIEFPVEAGSITRPINPATKISAYVVENGGEVPLLEISHTHSRYSATDPIDSTPASAKQGVLSYDYTKQDTIDGAIELLTITLPDGRRIQINLTSEPYSVLAGYMYELAENHIQSDTMPPIITDLSGIIALLN